MQKSENRCCKTECFWRTIICWLKLDAFPTPSFICGLTAIKGLTKLRANLVGPLQMRAQRLAWIPGQNWIQQLFAELSALNYQGAQMYLCTTLISVQQFDPWDVFWSVGYVSVACFLTFIYRGKARPSRASFSKLLRTLPVMEIHTREHPKSHLVSVALPLYRGD